MGQLFLFPPCSFTISIAAFYATLLSKRYVSGGSSSCASFRILRREGVIVNDCGQLQYKHLLDAIPVPMLIVDDDVCILDLNVAAMKAFGLSKDVIGSRRAGEILHCLHSTEVSEGCGRAPICRNCVIRNSVSNCLGAVSTTQRRMKFESITDETKTELELLISATPLPEAGKNAVLLIVEDITEISTLRKFSRSVHSANGFATKPNIGSRLTGTSTNISV